MSMLEAYLIMNAESIRTTLMITGIALLLATVFYTIVYLDQIVLARTNNIYKKPCFRWPICLASLGFVVFLAGGLFPSEKAFAMMYAVELANSDQIHSDDDRGNTEICSIVKNILIEKAGGDKDE